MKHPALIRVPKDMDKPRAALACRKALHQKTAYLSLFLTELVEHAAPVLEDRRVKAFLRELLGGPDGWGIHQRDFNAQSGGVLSRLKRDLPELSDKQLLLFSYTAAGFNNKLMCALLELSGEGSVSVMHSRLRARILKLDSPFRDEYLTYIPRKTCRIGQELLYLYNL